MIATAGTAAKADIAAAAGADDVIIYTETDFLEEVRRLTDGGSVSKSSTTALAPPPTSAVSTASSRAACWRSTAHPAVAVPELNPQILNAKGSLFLTPAPALGHYTLTCATNWNGARAMSCPGSRPAI